MTAEVAILNKTAVAVAADSAVTRGRNKVHISANKIFQLHKTMPIGIVIYNYADIFGLPWELIAKTYREEAHNRSFLRLGDVCEDFLAFLRRPTFLTGEAQEHDTLQIAFDLFRRLTRRNEFGSGVARNRLFRQAMEAFLKRNKTALPDGAYSLHKFRRYRGELCRLVLDDPDVGFRISAANQTLFVECVYDFIVHSGASNYHTGFAIFGYGSCDLMPSLWHCAVDGAPLGVLRVLDKAETKIDVLPPNNATIMAFAQKHAATLFMDGVSSEMKRYFQRSMALSLTGFGKKIFEEVKSLVVDPDALKVSEAIVKREIDRFMSGFKSEVDGYIQRENIDPVIRSIDGLGKGDMAALAESIVELASIKKKVSNEVETVGGPIDVAVVSKNDGFVWVKRKYYFDFELNRSFYQNYYDQKFRLEDRDGEQNGS